LNFLKNRGNRDAFEPAPGADTTGGASTAAGEAVYRVTVEGREYRVSVAEGGDISGIAPLDSGAAASDTDKNQSTGAAEAVKAPLAGTVIALQIREGQGVKKGDALIILEAMKMETAVSAPRDGVVLSLKVAAGTKVDVGDELITLA